MKRLLRNVTNRADRFLQRRPFTTLAGITVLCMAAEFFLLREIGTAFDALHQAMVGPGVARPVDDVANRSDRDRAAPLIQKGTVYLCRIPHSLCRATGAC
jgi:hypothetical protein